MNQTTRLENTDRLKLLRQVDRLVLAARSAPEIAEAAFPYIKQLVPFQQASLLLFNFEGEYATILAAESSPQSRAGTDRHLSLTDFWEIPKLRAEQRPVFRILTTGSNRSALESQLTAEGIQAYVILPLRLHGEIIGSLYLGLPHNEPPAAADLDMAQEITDQVAVAVQRTLLAEADQRRLLESETIANISQALNESLELEAVFQLIAESAWRVIPQAERTVIHLLDEQEQILQPITVTRGGEVARGGLMMRPGEGIAGHVIVQGRLINVTDTHFDPRFISSGHSQHRSLMVAPIKSREGIIGTITVQSAAAHAFTADDERLLTILGTQAALAIRNARLFAAEQHARNMAEILQSANIALTQTLDLDVVLDTLMEYLGRLIPYDSANVMLRQGQDKVVLSALRGYEEWLDAPQQLQGLTFDVTWPTIKPVFTRRESIIITDTEAVPEWDVSFGATHVRSWLGVPLFVGSEVIGLYSLDKAEPGFFTEEHRELAEALAGQAAIAIYNALLYKAEREQFRRLQQSQAQLMQAEKMGALGRLVASIAHEINNPIQAMQGCLTLTIEELAEPNPNPETVNLYLDIVKSEVNRVATIVRNMREFYRPAPPGMDLTDIHEVLESVLKLMRKQLQQSGVGLSLSWDKGVPFIEANQTHLRQIFLNLVLNAIDAMPQGGALHISTSLTEMPDYHPAKGAAVRIHIKDTGAGMSPETLSRLFEPFFTTKEQGSGLGLSISYGIIEAHYGEISVDSREGVGTEINVLLPVKQP